MNPFTWTIVILGSGMLLVLMATLAYAAFDSLKNYDKYGPWPLLFFIGVPVVVLLYAYH